MYGCFSMLLFGVFFIFIAALMGVLRILFGIRRSANAFKQTINGETTEKKKSAHNFSDSASSASSDKAQKSRNDNGKFFDKNEGEYVDFEDIPS